MKAGPEAVLSKQIRVAIARTKKARIVRNFTGKVVPWASPEARPVDAGLGKGGADLVGALVGSARLFCLEVKTKTGTVRPEQTLWLAAIRRIGGFATVVRSVPDALSALERAIQGESE